MDREEIRQFLAENLSISIDAYRDLGSIDIRVSLSIEGMEICYAFDSVRIEE